MKKEHSPPGHELVGGPVDSQAWVPELAQQGLRDRVYEVLRESILKRQFQPGSRLDLEQLETAMGISRTPLKEALQRLAADGLVEVVARRGTYVSELDVDQAIDCFRLRQILEGGAAPWILQNASDEEIAAVVAINDGMNELLDSGPYQEIVVEHIERDRLFHSALMGLTGNKALVEAHSGVNTHLQIARVNTSFVREQSDITTHEHARICDALTRRDEAELRAALCDHIRSSQERTVTAMGEDVQ